MLPPGASRPVAKKVKLLAKSCLPKYLNLIWNQRWLQEYATPTAYPVARDLVWDITEEHLMIEDEKVTWYASLLASASL